MKILIANSDYTAGLDAVRPLEIVRRLNEPSSCRFWVTLPAGMAAPLRNQRVVVEGDDGTVFFTGYLAVSPLPEYAGVGLAGPVYRLELQAVSDEILLDTQLLPPSAGTAGATAAQVVNGLVRRTGSALLSTGGVTLAAALGHFAPEAGAAWSRLAGQAAAEGRGAYRAVNGALTLAQAGSVVHSLVEANGSLALAGLSFTAAVERALANDVTVCGAEEPVAYVTEFFHGDGTTLQFALAAEPYFGPAAGERIIDEPFNEAAIDLRRWTYAGHEGFFSLSGAGLTGGLEISGGTGVDGEAALVWADSVEAGGTLLLEATGVTLSPGSTGTLVGAYGSAVLMADCVAGFQVSSAIGTGAGTGAVTVAPLVQGAVAGASFAINPANQYTLRTRIYCPEVERNTQIYRVVGDSGLEVFGGGGGVAQGRVLMEVEEFVDGEGSAPVVLYDAPVGFLPGSFTVAAASSVNLIGTIRGVRMSGLGTGWVSTVASGAASGSPLSSAQSLRIGAASDASECHMTRTGLLEFYTGHAPADGEIVIARYRTAGRAVGRAVNAASQAALLAAGSPGTAVWTGSVTGPLARSSYDCRNAAQALVTAASSVSAAWSGTYRTTNFGLGFGLGAGASGSDVWPGDALLLNSVSLGLDVQVLVRSVVVRYLASSPDRVEYAVVFSNDWANDFAVKTSRAVPADAWLPAAVSPTYLANLNELAVMAISSTAVTVAMNATPPAGGGFEVRRRDFSFQAGVDADLILRSTVGVFDVPRTADMVRFYVRMYDGGIDGTGGPPNYSEFSAGVFVNLPLSTSV
jgi:hypothetical protein